MGRKILSREDYAIHAVRAKKLNKAMVDHMAAVKTKDVAVLLSAGVDSHACLFAAMEAGKNVTCYSFAFKDQISTDFKIARETARQFGVPLVPVALPRDLLSLKRYLLDMYTNYSPTLNIHINKTSAECLWPFTLTLEAIKKNGHGATVLGLGGDVFFATLRSQKKEFLAGRFEQMKEIYYQNVVVNQNDVQTQVMNEWCKQNNPRHKLVSPFHIKPVFDIFKGMEPFDPGSRPIQKAPVRLAFFDKMFRTNVRIHVNLQKGDSGISDHFENLLIPSNWNTRGLKSVKGIYNDLETGEITKV